MPETSDPQRWQPCDTCIVSAVYSAYVLFCPPIPSSLQMDADDDSSRFTTMNRSESGASP